MCRHKYINADHFFHIQDQSIGCDPLRVYEVEDIGRKESNMCVGGGLIWLTLYKRGTEMGGSETDRWWCKR